MVFSSKNRQSRKQSGGAAEVDLLTTLFGLPNRQTLECEKRQRARRALTSYVPDHDRSVGDQQHISSSYEIADEGEGESSRAGPGISRRAEQRNADEDEDEEDYGQVESHQVIIKLPRRANLKGPPRHPIEEHEKKPLKHDQTKTPLDREKKKNRKKEKRTPIHRETREEPEEKPAKLHETNKTPEKRSKINKRRSDEQAPEVTKGSNASRISSTANTPPRSYSKSRSRSMTRESISKQAPTLSVPSVSESRLPFVPQLPLEFAMYPPVQNPFSLQMQQQQPFSQAYYQQISPAYPPAMNTLSMPVSHPMQFQQWNGPSYIPQPTAGGAQLAELGVLTSFQEVKAVQAQIDNTATQLRQNPNDAELNKEMKSLQGLLNDALNKATAHHDKDSTPFGRQPAQQSHIARLKHVDGDASLDPKEKEEGGKQKEDRALSEATPKPKPKPATASLSASVGHSSMYNPGSDAPRHRCHDCGNTRSLWYHEKYPIETCRRARNLCENCRDELIKVGIVGRRHYCFGCGRARSSQFHRSNPAIPGDALLLSQCGHCEDDMRTVVGTTNTTASAPVDDSRTLLSRERSASRYQGVMWDRRVLKSNESESLGRPTSQHPAEEQVLTGDTRKQSQHDIGMREYPDSEEDVTGSVDEESSYPVRNLGSFKRRAERASTTCLETENDSTMSSSKSSPEGQEESKYKQPWVEDSSSYVVVVETKAVSEAVRGHPTRLQQTDAASSVSSSSSTSSNPSELLCTPLPRAASSERTNGSAVSNRANSGSSRSSRSSHSSRSSSGKSVAFNPSVSVRQPSRRATTSDVSSDSDVEDTIIKPDDNSTPLRAGIYGDNPVMDEYGMPVSTPERLRSQRTWTRHPTGGSQRLWNFGQGTDFGSATAPGEGRRSFPAAASIGIDLDFDADSPTFDYSRGIFSGMSKFDVEDWGKLAEEVSGRESPAAFSGNDSSPNDSETRQGGYGSDGHAASFRSSSSHFEHRFSPSTPRPWNRGDWRGASPGNSPPFTGRDLGRDRSSSSWRSADNQTSPPSVLASFQDFSGTYSHDFDYDCYGGDYADYGGAYDGAYYDGGAFSYDDGAHGYGGGAYGYGDGYSDERRSELDGLRSVWSWNDAPGSHVTEPIVEEADTDEEEAGDKISTGSQKLLLEYHEPTTTPPGLNESSGDEEEVDGCAVTNNEESGHAVVNDYPGASTDAEW